MPSTSKDKMVVVVDDADAESSAEKEKMVVVVGDAEAESSTEKKMILLECNDGEKFLVEESLAAGSVFIKDFIEDDYCRGTIPLPNVNGPMMAKTVEYWKKHDGRNSQDEEMKKWDSVFVSGMDQNGLFELVTAANYLHCQPLLDLLCQTIANAIKDMKVEEVRDYFDIENDYTPEEEKSIMDKNQWAFE